jgi:hypothetical protein
MDASEISASIAQVDSMLDRVVKVIGRERPEKVLRPDVSYPRRTKPKPDYMVAAQPKSTPRHHVEPIASGELTGNEMRIGNGYSVRTWKSSDTCDPDGMWANFESDFDDMVAGMK